MNGGLSMVEMKNGYKMTEVGVIPEDWEVKNVSESCLIKARIGWQGAKKIRVYVFWRLFVDYRYRL